MEGDKVPIEEIFFSLQGEGKTAGNSALFIRFAGCNLRCVWCDSKFTWSIKKEKIKSIKEIEEEIDKKIVPFSRIVFTGGEPLLYQDAIIRFIDYISSKVPVEGFEVETNGTISEVKTELLRKIDLWNISPKPSWSQEPDYIDRTEPGLLELKNALQDYIVKFVVGEEKDLLFVEKIISKYEVPFDRVYLMPQGDNRAEYIKNAKFVWKACEEFGYKFSPRLHIVVWDMMRKV